MALRGSKGNCEPLKSAPSFVDPLLSSSRSFSPALHLALTHPISVHNLFTGRRRAEVGNASPRDPLGRLGHRVPFSLLATNGVCDHARRTIYVDSAIVRGGGSGIRLSIGSRIGLLAPLLLLVVLAVDALRIIKRGSNGSFLGLRGLLGLESGRPEAAIASQR